MRRPSTSWAGRTPSQEWQENPEVERLGPLTAVGPGAVEFAAFYPNCQGVFGFHDPSANADSDFEYCVIGWFASPTDDPLSESYTVTPWAAGTMPQSRAQALDWMLVDGDWSKQDGSIYVSKTRVNAVSCTAQPERVIPETAVVAAIGNTAGEALSAAIAGDTTDPAVGLPAQIDSQRRTSRRARQRP